MATATKRRTAAATRAQSGQRTLDVMERVVANPRGVDREKGIIYGAKVLGRNSKNGHTYTTESVRQSVSLYEGAAVNLNHPASGNALADRAVQDRFGELRNVTESGGELFGDLHYNTDHPQAPFIAQLAERFPLRFGLSPNHTIMESIQPKGPSEIIAITRVRSVDIVADPATTKGIFESRRNVMEDDMGLMGEAAITDSDPVRQAIIDGISQILDGDGEAADKAKRISDLVKQLLKVSDAVDAAVNGTTPADGGTEAATPADATESAKPGNPILAAAEVLESAGVPVTRVRLEAVAAMPTPAAAKALAESWKGSAPGALKTTSKPAMESARQQQQTTAPVKPDAKSVLSAMLGN